MANCLAPMHAQPGKKWELVWGDEFGAAGIDTAKWVMLTGQRRDGIWSEKAARAEGYGRKPDPTSRSRG